MSNVDGPLVNQSVVGVDYESPADAEARRWAKTPADQEGAVMTPVEPEPMPEPMPEPEPTPAEPQPAEPEETTPAG